MRFCGPVEVDRKLRFRARRIPARRGGTPALAGFRGGRPLPPPGGPRRRPGPSGLLADRSASSPEGPGRRRGPPGGGRGRPPRNPARAGVPPRRAGMRRARKRSLRSTSTGPQNRMLWSLVEKLVQVGRNALRKCNFPERDPRSARFFKTIYLLKSASCPVVERSLLLRACRETPFSRKRSPPYFLPWLHRVGNIGCPPIANSVAAFRTYDS